MMCKNSMCCASAAAHIQMRFGQVRIAVRFAPPTRSMVAERKCFMRINRQTGALLLTIFAAASWMLGGCAMGSATGDKTVQGAAALEDGDYQTAQQLFEEAVQDQEQEMLAYRGLGMAYMGLGQYTEAEEAFETALEWCDDRMPENRRDISLYLATAQYRLGEYEKTADTCSGILEESENGSAQAYFLRGASCLHQELPADAQQDFDAATALEPENFDLYLNIYECYDEMNLSGAGGGYLQKALNIQGDDMEHYYNRGRIYYYLEDYTKAQEQLIGPVESGYEPAMYLIARVYVAQQDFGHAQSTYEQIRQKSGDSEQVFNGLALCALESGDCDTALSYITQGLELEGMAGKQELYFNEIVAYERKLDFATAKAKAQEYVQRYPGDAAGQKELMFLQSR